MATREARIEVALPTRRVRRGPAAGGERTWSELVLEFVQRRTLGAAGAVFIVLMMVLAALAGVVAPHDPYETSFLDQLKPPSGAHWLGTDAFGRDILSRLIYGARTALKIGFGAAVTGASIGALLGVVGAYFGGMVDLLLERLMDILISFPLLILALAVVTALGNNDTNVIIAITLPIIPRVARVIRASALSIRQTPYVEAALSFLGLGVAEPTPAWGLMLRGASVQFIERAPWLAIAPGLALSLAVFAFNLLGDSLRDALDP